MKFETKVLKPTLERFIGLLVLSLVVIFFFRSIVDLIIFNQPINISNWWMPMLLVALGNAAGVTFGTRKHQMTISDLGDLSLAKNVVFKSFPDYFGTKRETEIGSVTLKPMNTFNRLFNCWFGLESVSITTVNNQIIVEGPSRIIGSLKSNIVSALAN